MMIVKGGSGKWLEAVSKPSPNMANNIHCSPLIHQSIHLIIDGFQVGQAWFWLHKFTLLPSSANGCRFMRIFNVFSQGNYLSIFDIEHLQWFPSEVKWRPQSPTVTPSLVPCQRQDPAAHKPLVWSFLCPYKYIKKTLSVFLIVSFNTILFS